MAEPTLREAVVEDVPALHALVERGYRGDSAKAGWTHEADLLGGQRTDAATLTAIIADPAQRIILAFVEGVLTGCVQLSLKPDGVAYLGLLTVDPARQAGGLGGKLIAACEAAAREAGANTLEMTVIARRRELIDWYVRKGFAATGETRPFPYDDPNVGLPQSRDLDFVVLAKAL